MTEELITKEKTKELLSIAGKTTGMGVKDVFEYVLKEEGTRGVKKLEKKMEELECPLKYDQIKGTELYPIGSKVVILLAAREIFNLDEEGMRKIGEFSAKLPSPVRFFMKFFGSLKLVVKEAPNMWKRYYTEGIIEVPELNEREGFLIVRLSKFKLHPIHCLDLEGYFRGVIRMVIGKKAVCEEVKCPFKGDEYHEFIVRW